VKKSVWCRLGIHKFRCVYEQIFYGWDYECVRPGCGAKHHDTPMG